MNYTNSDQNKIKEKQYKTEGKLLITYIQGKCRMGREYKVIYCQERQCT